MTSRVKNWLAAFPKLAPRIEGKPALEQLVKRVTTQKEDEALKSFPSPTPTLVSRARSKDEDLEGKDTQDEHESVVDDAFVILPPNKKHSSGVTARLPRAESAEDPEEQDKIMLQAFGYLKKT
jgi:hypothetical protein